MVMKHGVIPAQVPAASTKTCATAAAGTTSKASPTAMRHRCRRALGILFNDPAGPYRARGSSSTSKPAAPRRRRRRLRRPGTPAYKPSIPASAMKFDLLYELQVPKPHDERSEWRCYQEALEQIELADRLGFDTVWAVEHHFLSEFAHSSAPEVFLTAAAARTKKIRIGHGVVLLPSKFNHPIRVAERVAALDLISNGRVEFGTGRSSQYEQAGFEIDTDLSREMWQESLSIIPRMWTEDPF